MSHQDITDEIFSGWMSQCGPFEGAPHVAVALSGGCDSMALLWLARRWALGAGGRVSALTVHHGLRPETDAEIEYLSALCAGLGVEHHVLYWEHEGVQSGIQAKAREARYELLSAWCRDAGVLHLLTGHHQDDQGETLILRVAGGSGLAGLSGMAMVASIGGVRLLRPLLGANKSMLAALLERAGLSWIEDKSNASQAYTRNRVRQHLGDNSGDAAQLAGRFEAVRKAMQRQEASLLTELVSIYPEGYATLPYDGFGALAAEQKMSVVAAVACCISGQAHPPRREAVAGFLASLEKQAGATLHGLMWREGRGRLLFVHRESAAIQGPLPASRSMVWDGRFHISCDAPKGYHVAMLGSDGLAQAERFAEPLVRRAGRRITAQIPALWYLEKLVAAPHIHFNAETPPSAQMRAVLCAAKPLAGWPFFGLNS